jgi:hypothetical protein
VAQPLNSLALATQWMPRPSRSLRRAGVGNAGASLLIHVVVVTNQVEHAASPPTLAKNARMGRPLWKWCTQKSLKVGHPPFAPHVNVTGGQSAFGPQANLAPKSERVPSAPKPPKDGDSQ